MNVFAFAFRLIDLDAVSLVAILVWCNGALALLVYSFKFTRSVSDEKKRIGVYGFSRIIQTIAWIFVFFREDLSGPVPALLGNSLLCFSFYLETRLFLGMLDKARSLWFRMQNGLFAASTVLTCAVELSGSGPGARAAVMSSSLFMLYLVPVFMYVRVKSDTAFKQVFGGTYIVFLGLLLASGIAGFTRFDDAAGAGSVATVSMYIVFLLMAVVGGTGFMLLVKERADKDLAALAFLDPLTKTMNRRSFFDSAARVFDRHCRYGERLAVLFLDIDWFKKVNDTHGHAFGDEVLKVTANAIRRSVKTTDLSCRYGGEEFVILLSYSGTEEGVRVATVVREEIEKSRFASRPAFVFSASIGLFSAVPFPSDSLESFIDLADKALYKAKETGRNRIFIHEQDALKPVEAIAK